MELHTLNARGRQRIPYRLIELGQILSKAPAAVVDADSTSEYQCLNFYGSHDPNSEADRKLHRWSTTIVDTFPGVSVSIVPRQRKRSPPVCPACHTVVDKCPVCNSDMRMTEGKGVDVRMVTNTSVNTIVFDCTKHSVSALKGDIQLSRTRRVNFV